MNWILRIVAVIVFVAALVVPAAINCYGGEYGDDNKKVGKGWAVFGVVAAVLMFVLSCSFVIIPTGYTGVRTTFGQVSEDAVPNGFNWKIPFVQSIEKMNNKQQDVTFDGQVWSETNERTAIYYEGVTLTYQINPEKSTWIYANVTNYKEALVSQDIVASAIKSSSKGLDDEDATNRSIIEPLVVENLQESLDGKYGEGVVIVNKITISNADFDESYNQAIAEKQQAQVNAEQQAIENQQAIDKAEADATVTKTNAQAAAEAKIIEAQAEAEANELLEKSLTDMILRQMYIEKWDGELPSVIAGDESATIMVQPTETEAE